jgi:hypothetical protein
VDVQLAVPALRARCPRRPAHGAQLPFLPPFPVRPARSWAIPRSARMILLRSAHSIALRVCWGVGVSMSPTEPATADVPRGFRSAPFTWST